MENSDRIPDSVHSKFASITSKTDAFCQRYLHDEYRQLVRTAVAALCRKRPSPLPRGSEDFWAAGVIHAIGTANFVFDKSQTPHCNAPDIYSFFGVASSTGQGKSKQIRQWLKIHPFSSQWGLPSQRGDFRVATIHTFGGTILGSSRGAQDAGEMVDHLEELGVDILFVVGGDGTLKGGARINAEIRRRGLKKSVVGIPKTIDNDIMYLDKSFGFDTAFAEAVKTVSCAHVEAMGAMNGIGLVKLMGRHSGFIACYAALAGQHVNYCLIPEVPFHLDGPSGLLETLRYRLAKRKHAVIVVAEGAGQDLIDGDLLETDASGNRRPGNIGEFLKGKITEFFKNRRIELNLKYIDPSYTIRSVPASAQDNVYCLRLAQYAVHAAMAGKTNMLIVARHFCLYSVRTYHQWAAQSRSGCRLMASCAGMHGPTSATPVSYRASEPDGSDSFINSA